MPLNTKLSTVKNNTHRNKGISANPAHELFESQMAIPMAVIKKDNNVIANNMNSTIAVIHKPLRGLFCEVVMAGPLYKYEYFPRIYRTKFRQ